MQLFDSGFGLVFGLCLCVYVAENFFFQSILITVASLAPFQIDRDEIEKKTDHAKFPNVFMFDCPSLAVSRRRGDIVKVILVVTIVLTPVDGSQLQHPEAGCGAQAGRGASPLGDFSRAAGGHLRIGGRGGRRE